MNIALFKPESEAKRKPLYYRKPGFQVTSELDNVAHGLKFFGEKLAKTHAAQALFAIIWQLKIWVTNKPTIENLLAQYMAQVEQTQLHLHLDPQAYDESIKSLCEQLMFLGDVFEQESELIEQLVFVDPQLVLCD